MRFGTKRYEKLFGPCLPRLCPCMSVPCPGLPGSPQSLPKPPPWLGQTCPDLLGTTKMYVLLGLPRVCPDFTKMDHRKQDPDHRAPLVHKMYQVRLPAPKVCQNYCKMCHIVYKRCTKHVETGKIVSKYVEIATDQNAAMRTNPFNIHRKYA